VSKGVQIAAGATLIALLFGWYATSNLVPGAAFTYFQDLDEFQAAAEQYTGQHARVRGFVTPGSIERDLAAKQVRFRVQQSPPQAGSNSPNSLPMLSVVYAGLETPDLFKDGAEVVVEGVLSSAGPDGVFRADKVLAKCPSKFEAAPEQTVSNS
jgi:cytochrome c-type biogenesis protein CcmE